MYPVFKWASTNWYCSYYSWRNIINAYGTQGKMNMEDEFDMTIREKDWGIDDNPEDIEEAILDNDCE